MTSFVFHDSKWTEGDPPLLTAMSHAVWLSSIVFDGARSFEGVTPDLAFHCERAVNSCRAFAMNPTLSTHEMVEIALDGVAKFPSGAELYIRPMFWAQEGWIAPDPESTQFAMLVYESPLPPATGFGACLSTRRRPAPDQAMTDAKASCLYPNAGRALKEAAARGFDNAVVLDPNGNVAEFATSNLFTVADGVAHTPIPNGTFLNGITRQRVINLLRGRDVEVVERSMTPADLLAADEIFSTGNHGKVIPVIRYEDHDFQPGPVSQLARDLYWEYAHQGN
ncbi:MAG: branched-chain amino acid aminotransferase [Alphaproteobacteria bacterium]